MTDAYTMWVLETFITQERRVCLLEHLRELRERGYSTITASKISFTWCEGQEFLQLETNIGELVLTEDLEFFHV